MKNAIALLALATVCSSGPAIAQNDYNQNDHGSIKRVLLISIDGMHAVDFTNCAKGVSTANGGEPYCPALAALGKTGNGQTGFLERTGATVLRPAHRRDRVPNGSLARSTMAGVRLVRR